MKQWRVFLIALSLITVYFFLFPRAAGLELLIEPVALLRIGTDRLPERVGKEHLGLDLGGQALYLDESFLPLRLWQGRKVAVNDSWWAIHDGAGVVVRNPDGRFISKRQSAGRPFSVASQLFLYNPDLEELSKINPQTAQVYWSRRFFSTITAIDAREERTLIGLLDGRCFVIDNSAEVLMEYQAEGSPYNAIYGAAFSEDGSKIALVAGIKPQNFILLEENKNAFHQVSLHPTQTDSRHPVPVGFIRNDSRAVYQAGSSIAMVDTGNYDIQHLNLGFPATAWMEAPNVDAVIFLGNSNHKSALRILSRTNKPILELLFAQPVLSMRLDEERIYLVTDDGFVALEMLFQ